MTLSNPWRRRSVGQSGDRSVPLASQTRSPPCPLPTGPNPSSCPSAAGSVRVRPRKEESARLSSSPDLPASHRRTRARRLASLVAIVVFGLFGVAASLLVEIALIMVTSGLTLETPHPVGTTD